MYFDSVAMLTETNFNVSQLNVSRWIAVTQTHLTFQQLMPVFQGGRHGVLSAATWYFRNDGRIQRYSLEV